jgi:hypothetical protein
VLEHRDTPAVHLTAQRGGRGVGRAEADENHRFGLRPDALVVARAERPHLGEQSALATRARYSAGIQTVSPNAANPGPERP